MGSPRVGHCLATKPPPPKHIRIRVGSGKTIYQNLPLLAPQSGCDPTLISGWKSAKEVIYSRVLIRGRDKALSILVTLPFLSPSQGSVFPFFLLFHLCCRLESAVLPCIVLSFSFPDVYLQVCLKPKLKGELWGLEVKKKLGKFQELSLPGKVVNV